MQTDDRIYPLLDHWVAEADAGRLLPAAEVCRDCPELLPEAEREIAVLRQFHLLAQPSMSGTTEQHGKHETTHGHESDGVEFGTCLRVGTQFGRYEILAELGKGGMGIVYMARDTQLNREVALKVMRPDLATHTGAFDRFLSEARALAAVHHDHVVAIYDYGESNGMRFITMPLLAGESLETRLQRQNWLPPAEVVRIGVELADGLAAVHKQGLIHRDLKPSNVWLEAPSDRVKLLDFGLARESEAGDRLTRSGALVGTPAYMSPEQANGLALDDRTDLFSLGSVLYRAATGYLPFPGKTATATLKLIGEHDAPPATTLNSLIPTGLSDLIEWLHRKNPAERPATAAHAAKAFRELTAASLTSTSEWHGARAKGERRKKWAYRAKISAFLPLSLFVVIAVILVLTRDRFREARPEDGKPISAAQQREPVRIRALEIPHAEAIDDKKTKARRTLGQDSFGAALDDDIKVTARLSRPAYCYVIVFRADGKDEVLSPQSAGEAPALTDEPRYPSTDRSKVYGLSDGNGGLWLVALVASDKPLPPYSEWRKQHPDCPWVKSPGEANVVWFDDGQWLASMAGGGLRNRGKRGEKEAPGAVPIVRVVDWLKAETDGVVSAVAFTVQAKK
jgi:serine/threonine protein kinase